MESHIGQALKHQWFHKTGDVQPIKYTPLFIAFCSVQLHVDCVNNEKIRANNIMISKVNMYYSARIPQIVGQ